MAVVPVRLSATIVDAWGIESSTAFYANADDTKVIADLDTEAGSWLSALDNATDGVIKDARITLFPALPGDVKATAVNPTAGGALVEQVGALGFNAAGSAKKYTAYVPALSNGATVLSGDRIVLSAVDPIGLLIKILTTVGTVLTWCNDHYQDISKFIDAFVAIHKRRKQLQRSSFEVG